MTESDEVDGARCQAETPLIVLFRFSRPALAPTSGIDVP
jgi:hypothetical protein